MSIISTSVPTVASQAVIPNQGSRSPDNAASVKAQTQLPSASATGAQGAVANSTAASANRTTSSRPNERVDASFSKNSASKKQDAPANGDSSGSPGRLSLVA